MKKQGLETWLYSALGLAALFLVIVALNAAAGRAKTRIDLTAEHAYTLSPGTRAILAKLDTPVQIRFYCTRGDSTMPVALKTYAQQVEDLLDEYRQASKGLVDIQKLDPAPDSDAEDSAKLDGVEGQRRLDGEPIYLGLSVSMLDQKEVLPFLAPDRERLLEYDISHAITRVAAADKPVVGVMSPLPVAGMRVDPRKPRQRAQPAWTLYSQLEEDFTVKTVDMEADQIPGDVRVLLLIHPKEISDRTQYAIDQFLLRGGKLMAFLDPQCLLDPASKEGPSSSNLEKLLKAWGLAFESNKIVADLDYVTPTRQGRQPLALTLNENAVNKDDVLTSNSDHLILLFAGAFQGTPAEGLKETVLLKSSPNSQLIDSARAQADGGNIIRDFARSGTEYPLALRLTGKFKTAFPNGKPKAPELPAMPGEKKPDAPAAAGLKVSTTETAVILVGDADFIQDRLAVQETVSPFGGQRMVTPANGNLAFVLGAIDQLAGDDNLVAMRGRASRARQFTVVKELQAKAEAAYQNKIKELETSLTETRGKLGELRHATDENGGQKFILSPEQQAEIANFRVKETEVKQQLKGERKKLRADIDSLENRIKWLNIGLMPAMVAVGGAGLAAVRHRRRAAR
ncbi:MAG TPA: Gldg family protein [Chthoniobacter sp.]|jgi:ABC-type uncharacterized transport system involved in gliding motility auxiliary subunit